MPNENHTIPAAYNGTVSTSSPDNYLGSGTDIRVFKGSTALTHKDSGSAGLGEFKVSVNSDTNITVASGSFISTKGTNQLAFTSDYKDDVENTGQLLCTSTSGGSTTVSAYRTM